MATATSTAEKWTDFLKGQMSKCAIGTVIGATPHIL
jgi:hypothetical protein